MGRRAKNKQGPPQSIEVAATNAKRKAEGYVPRSGGKKVKLGPNGKKIGKGKHASVSRGGDRVERGMSDDGESEGEGDDDEQERKIKRGKLQPVQKKGKGKEVVKSVALSFLPLLPVIPLLLHDSLSARHALRQSKRLLSPSSKWLAYSVVGGSNPPH